MINPVDTRAPVVFSYRMTTSWFSRLCLMKLNLAMHPDKTSLAPSHLHPQDFSFAHREDKTAEWGFL